ncbi:Clavaminate synthase-like protein [Nemania sp. FL0916]|nr:Clavaminate synthase-like protein [Nemania sp. FL0916]
MSIASMKIPSQISQHLGQVAENHSTKFHAPPVKKQKAGSSCSLGGDISSRSDNTTAYRRKNHTIEGDLGIKPLSPGPTHTKSIAERAKAAAIVLNRYRIEYKNDWDFPESILHSETQIYKALERGVPIELVIPAFPFKSSNRSKKVLGPLPDEAERLSLLHLNGLCLAIRDSTGSDTFLTIVSDGITYSDILDVSDQEVWSYGQHLRQIAEQNRCHYIRFARICDLVGKDYESQHLDEALYLAKVAEYRSLLEANTPSDFNVLEAITNDPDISKTYKGYKKFLMTERDDRNDRSRSQTERENSAIAKAMIVRGKAFAETIRTKYPGFVRLSIHPSNDTKKVSITMLPQDNKTVMTPWHGAVVRGADGSVSMSHAILIPAMTHEIAYADRRPSYFRERSDVFSWPAMDVIFEYLYPCGILIRPSKPTEAYPLSMVDMKKIRELATTCSPIILRGFSRAKEPQAYLVKEHDCTLPFSGKSNLIQDIESQLRKDLQNNDVVSHCNIVSQAATTSDKGTRNNNFPDNSQLQYFVSGLSCQTRDSDVLFASSTLLARYLPQAYNIQKLEKIKWTYRNQGSTMENIPLITRHPTRNSPCLRWHQNWSKRRTSCGSTDIGIDNGSQSLIALIDSLLLDRRVCLRFPQQEGDVFVFDSLAVLHTL